jgi:hypothetical protein
MILRLPFPVYVLFCIVLLAAMATTLAYLPRTFPTLSWASSQAQATSITTWPDVGFPPPPMPPQCGHNTGSFQKYGNGSFIQRTGTDYDVILKASDGTPLVKVEMALATTKEGEIVLYPYITRLIAGGDDGLSTLAMYAAAKVMGPQILQETGLNVIKVLWFSAQGYTWDCLFTLMGGSRSNTTVFDDEVMPYFVIKK